MTLPAQAALLREKVEQLLVPQDCSRPSWDELKSWNDAINAVLALLDAETPAPDPKLLTIAGLVNTYHNSNEGQVALTAFRTLRAIADTLGEPMEPVTAPAQEPR